MPLRQTIDNRAGQLKVALCDILYHPLWKNISAEMGNNKFLVNGVPHLIPDGYYSMCALHEEIFKPLGMSLTLNPGNGRLTMGSPTLKEVLLIQGLAATLGFNPQAITLLAEQSAYAPKLPCLVPNKELYVHLADISSSENIPQSNVLRTLPVKEERFNSGRAESFTQLQYKKLQLGLITGFTISVLDAAGRPVHIGYMSVTLHII